MTEFAKYQAIASIHQFECFEGTFTQQVFPWHFHDTYTLILVERGAVTYEFRQAKKTVSAGEILIINPFVSHLNYAATQSGWSYRVFFVPMRKKEIHSLCLYVPGSRYFCPEPFKNPALYASLSRLHQQLTTFPEPALHQEIYSEITSLLAAYIPFQGELSPIDPRIQIAIAYIEQQVQTQITIAQLANVANLSPFHFQRLFKEQTGLTAHAFLTMKRMETGKALLKSGQGITSTAMETGFYDQSHFHHRFRKMYGLTPKQFALPT
jgi:AraC-like DNA-binding protein